MGISVNQTEEFTIITVHTITLAGDDASDLKDKAVELLESGITKLSLDLSKTEYINSSGIGKLLFLNKKLEKAGGKFEIIKIHKKLYSFLESLAITEVMTVAKPE